MLKGPSRYFLIAMLSSLAFFGCASSSAMFPVHEEVLVFPLPVDLVYLRTLEAVDLHPDWELDRTFKEKGLIYLRNLRYSSFADADRRTATLVIKRIGSRETSIQFAPDSQTVVGGGELLALIKRHLSGEPSRKNP